MLTPAQHTAIKVAMLDAARRASNVYPDTRLTAHVVDVQDEPGGAVVQTRLDFDSSTRAGVALTVDWRDGSVWYRTGARPGDTALEAWLEAADVAGTIGPFLADEANPLEAVTGTWGWLA